MPGTKLGGQRQRETMLKRFGQNDEGKLAFFVEIGAIGGSRKVPKGFAMSRERASIAGRKGGLKKRKKETEKTWTAHKRFLSFLFNRES